LQQWLTGAVFRRPSIDRALQHIRTRPAPGEAEPQYLVWAASVMADFMSTERFELVSDPQVAWAEAFVPLRFSQGDQSYIILGRRRGGRRYLSEDLACLARLAGAVTEQVERYRAIELQRLVSHAELRALQSQINPHFLFNALNTLYGTIPREIAGARQTVLNLAEIFRYFLQLDKTFIPLEEELKIIQAYLDIERLRLGPRLITHIEVDDEALNVPIPILSIQPLVENAIKHGVSAKSDPGTLSLRIRRDPHQIHISISDTGPGMSSDSSVAGSGSKLGLANVSRRLALCYGPQHALTISSSMAGTIVEFAVPLDVSAKSLERDMPAVC
jgi:LytS/YehU family sensor histidine kinase